jgi:hypothetical protein
MRYYLTTPNGEKGPYEEEQVREWLRAGTMPRDAPTRAEHETTTAPAEVVFPGVAPPPAPRPPAPAPVNVYAPPVDVGVAPSDWVQANQGNFAQGFIFGFCCGCIALIVSYTSSSMGSETKRGVRYGFAAGFAFGMVVRIIAAASR